MRIIRQERVERPLESSALPWTSEQFARLLGTQFLGLVGVSLAWVGASGTGVVGDQLLFAELGVVATLVAGGGAGAWFLQGCRQVGRRRRQLLAAWVVAPGLAPPSASAVTGLLPSDEAVVVEGGTLVHRFGCALTVGKGIRVVSESISCEVCSP